MLLYSLGLLAALFVSSPYWLLRMGRNGRYRNGLDQRVGQVPRSLREFAAGRQTIWVHAVSVGEVMAATRLVEMLDATRVGLPVVISTTTATGQQTARKQFGADNNTAGRVFYYPLDFAWAVRAYLAALRPSAIVLLESELWPRMLLEASRRNIPVIVVNGRVSDRSLPRYRALRPLWTPLLRTLTLVLAQSEQDAERFASIGVPRLKIVAAGNLKYDLRAATGAPVVSRLREYVPGGTRVIVAGSTLEGEEAVLLDAFRALLARDANLILILAPRHPERFGAVRKLVDRAGLPCIARSAWLRDPRSISPGTVFLLDSIGELAAVYSLAAAAFVGGSLFGAGGHNPLEPAQFGVPIVTGPSMQNFREVFAELVKKEAVRVAEPAALADVLGQILGSSEAAQMGVRAREVFARNAGASERCFHAIMNVLAERGAVSDAAPEPR